MKVKSLLSALVLAVLTLGPSCAPASRSATLRVIEVKDGDTIVVKGGEQVRYIGIDTPEIYPEVEAFGIEAWQANRALVDGKMVRLEKDISDKDKYGRLLRYVYVDHVFVNVELVRRGLAHVYPESWFPDNKYYHQLKQREKPRMRGEDYGGTKFRRDGEASYYA